MGDLLSGELSHYRASLIVEGRSPVTIHDRCALLARLRDHLGKPLLEATPGDLTGFQQQFSHLAPASIDIYTRHVRAFYRWAARNGHIGADPSTLMGRTNVPKGRPHPVPLSELRIIFDCTPTGPLRLAYVLATFAGLRCGEITRLHRRDITGTPPVALIHGKGRRQRHVPLLPVVEAELAAHGSPGIVVTEKGQRLTPSRLSLLSHLHLRGLGLATATLHGLRHAFASSVAQLTHDPLFVRDLLGHSSVATTEIYMASPMAAAHGRLTGLMDIADDVIGQNRRLRSVG